MTRLGTSRFGLVLALAVVWCVAMLAVALMREAPVGAIQGKVIGADTNRPIEGASVWITPRDSHDPYPASTNCKTDKLGEFHFTNISPGRYTIEASAQVHSLPKAGVAVREGHTEYIKLRLKPGPPNLSLHTTQNVYTPKESPALTLEGFSKSSNITLDIYRVDLARFLTPDAELIRGVVAGRSEKVDRRAIESNPALSLSKKRTVTITKRDSEGVYRQNLSLGAMSQGAYIVLASTDDLLALSWVSVTDLSIVTKVSSNSMLVYAVRSDTGEPVPGAQIGIMQGKSVTASGAADESGIWTTSFPGQSGAQPNRFIFARDADSAAFVYSSTYDEAPNPVTIYAYTDRPVYRPGQMVNLKAIVRRFAGDSYALPSARTAHVQVQDPKGTSVYSADLPLTRFGSFAGSFKLPDYASTGNYDMSCMCAGKTESASFQVAAYSKPEFNVSVEFNKKRYVRGETVKATIHANYYFGAPVVGAAIHYSVERSDKYFWPTDEEGDVSEYDDYGGYGETATEGKTLTGADGTVEITFRADWKSPRDFYSVMDQNFTVYAGVTDPSGRESTGVSSILATQGDYRLSVQPAQYVTSPGQTTRVNLTASDYSGKPRSGARISVTTLREQWNEGEEEFTQVANADLQTDKSGKATFQFEPTKAGNYVIRASSQDEHGNVIKSSEWLWVSGEGNIKGYKYPDLKIVLDKKTYNTGDTAKVLINSETTGVTALVTVEGRQLYLHKTVKLTSKSTLLELPVEASYRPNFYVSVCYIKNKKLISQEAKTRVSLKAESLKISVIPDKKTYEPGEKATYLIKATDAAGRPVSAEVSLGVVDEAVYAVMEDSTPSILGYFYARQPNAVQTSYSSPEVYLSGDKAGFTGKVRKDFRDTAFWRAEVVTDKNGEARVSFNMPDNLTEWRATARACTLNTAVGECRTNVVTSKKLLVRLEAPRFLVEGDQCVIKAIVHNELSIKQRVKLQINMPGLSTRDPLLVTLDIGSKAMKSAQWLVKSDKPGDVRLTAYAVARKAQDAMQITLPIHPRGIRQMRTVTGSMRQGSVAKTITVSGDAVPNSSEIRIRLAPSIASTMLGSLGYLAEYPYGCTEQTMSAFLPDVAVWRAMKSLGINDPALQARLPDMVGKGLSRIYDSRNENGGWGWCQYGDQDLWMTSYVVYGLLTARSAGFAVNNDILDSGITATKAELKKKPTTGEDPKGRLFALYVMSLTGESDYTWQTLQPILTKGISKPQELAYAAIIATDAKQTKIAKNLMTQLWLQAEISNGYAHWNETDSWGGSQFEATAVALTAVMRVSPEDPRATDIIRWLLANRLFNHWESTRDTAITLYALSDYVKRSKELKPDYSVRIAVNGKKVGEARFTNTSVFAPEREIVIHPQDVASGNNTITLQMAGKGTLYYGIQIQQYVRWKGRAKASKSVLSISREYHKLVSGGSALAGTRRLVAASGNSTDFRVGDVVRVKLVVSNNSGHDLHRLLVEDYLPAGCEAFDRGKLDPWEWDYWYSDRDVRDDRVSFYVDTLSRGKNVLEYEVRATTPGVYCAIPPLIEAMYATSLAARGQAATVRIGD